jgi:DNA-binding MarR family transcriptional regulator
LQCAAGGRYSGVEGRGAACRSKRVGRLVYFLLTIVVVTTIFSTVKTKNCKTAAVSLEAKFFVALLRVADRLAQDAEVLIKAHGLTATQYNVLRILRGAGGDGLPCKRVGDRMISRDPDMTRLLDRMEKRGLITRERQTDDRRVIKTRITSAGLEILKELDTPVDELHRKQFRHISAAKLKALVDALEEAFPAAAPE